MYHFINFLGFCGSPDDCVWKKLTVLQRDRERRLVNKPSVLLEVMHMPLNNPTTIESWPSVHFVLLPTTRSQVIFPSLLPYKMFLSGFGLELVPLSFMMIVGKLLDWKIEDLIKTIHNNKLYRLMLIALSRCPWIGLDFKTIIIAQFWWINYFLFGCYGVALSTLDILITTLISREKKIKLQNTGQNILNVRTQN